jgi:Nif-specific regulatory protein
LREKSDAFEDGELRDGYLALIPEHGEINRLHEELQGRTRKDAARRERSFHEIARSIHSIVELDPLLDRLLELAIETTHAEKGLILLKDPLGDFTTRAARGMARESVEDAKDICRSVISDVAQAGQPVLATDAGSDARFRDRQSIISFQIRTLMCVPLVVRDEIIGAVYVDGRGVQSFARADLDYMVSFAQLAAIAVDNVRLLENLRAENRGLRREVESRYRFENLIAESDVMVPVLDVMAKVARTAASILLSGETGTGKEVIARAIHYASERRSRPIVAVDCGALPENLLESELFGHRRGAFSGAIHNRVGLFEEADGGTLFLDEITNTSLDLQAKLLRVLQEGEVRRVGENQTRKVDVRVVAATNVNARDAVAGGRFREDLFYRLNVVAIEVPPLRERTEDIPLLAAHFLARSASRHSIDGGVVLTPDALRFLLELPWRGNVRELENLMEKAVILADESHLTAAFVASLVSPATRAERVPQFAGETASSASPEAPAADAPSSVEAAPASSMALEAFDRDWRDAERRYLLELVEGAGWNLSEAARRAEVQNRNTLISRLKKHGIQRQR